MLAEIVPWPTAESEQRRLIERAADAIRAGQVVAFPTDTVYGIAAGAFDAETVQRLYDLKERPAHKAIALLLASTAQAEEITDGSLAGFRELATAFWPGALTIVVPWKPRAGLVSAQPFSTVGLRVPAHPVPQALIRAVGRPLATTSANLSGAPSTTTAGEVAAQIGERVALIIDGGQCPVGRDSTVIDLTVRPPVIRRPGAISAEELSRVLGTEVG